VPVSSWWKGRLHSACDGSWSPDDCSVLGEALQTIQSEFKRLPPIQALGEWQTSVVKSLGVTIQNLDDCFFDVDGESLTERLIGLARLAHQRREPVLFQ
jgi:hypothetical protein